MNINNILFDNSMMLQMVYKNLLKDLDRLPRQTTNTKADGNKGETRSINIPATK